MHINYASTSGQKTASAQISTNPGALCGIDVTPPTSGYTTLVVYDSENSNISGKTILSEVIVDAGFTGVNHEFFAPQVVNRGIYCVLSSTGTGSHYYIRFILG